MLLLAYFVTLFMSTVTFSSAYGNLSRCKVTQLTASQYTASPRSANQSIWLDQI